MKIKKLVSIGVALVVAFSSLLAVISPQVASALAPYTCTCTGATNNNFSNAGNWSGCNGAAPVPTDNDNLVFDSSATNLTPSNDLTNATFTTVTFSGSAGDFSLTGNSFTVTGGITDSDTFVNLQGVGFTTIANNITFTGDQSITLTASDESLDLMGVISGTANLTKAGAGTLYLVGANTFSGNFTVNTGMVYASTATALGTSAGVTTVNGSASLNFNIIGGSSATVNEPITLNSSASPALNVDSCAGPCDANYTITLAGPMALQQNTLVGGHANAVITGALSGNFTIQMIGGQAGTLTINSSNNTSATPNGGQTSTNKVTTIAVGDNQPGVDLTVAANNTLLLNGIRGVIAVAANGTLKGSGTAGAVSITANGIIAPGQSPGCLNTGDLLLNGIYQAELGGTTACSGYDQINVTGTVTLFTGGTNTTTLTPSIYGTFKPAKGNIFTIIKNDGSDAVAGTFNGLPEGSSINVAGYVFKISYVGGDGNDVTLTVMSVPAAPNTGFALIKANPVASLAATTILSAGILVIARRSRKLGARR